jgi:hypothetical protein
MTRTIANGLGALAIVVLVEIMLLWHTSVWILVTCPIVIVVIILTVILSKLSDKIEHPTLTTLSPETNPAIGRRYYYHRNFGGEQ